MAGKPAKQRRRAAKPRVREEDVFLNIPYDARFENLLLAYIAGISAFGFAPRATLEIPFGQRRLDRILSLIRQSRYSIHDLSRVELDPNAPRTPRFRRDPSAPLRAGYGAPSCVVASAEQQIPPASLRSRVGMTKV
jgi:hypothetical protein